MDISSEELKGLMKQVEAETAEVLGNRPSKSLSDIEDLVAEAKQLYGKTLAEKILALKKRDYTPTL